MTMDAVKTYSPARAVSSTEVSHWDIETDVIIVGFGAAGACAAIEARRAEADVVVLEVADVGGGSASLSGGEVYVGGNGGNGCSARAWV